MDCQYFRLSNFDKHNPKVKPGSEWVKLLTKWIDHGEDFRELSDCAKLTFMALLAAAPKQKNIFPNDPEFLRGVLGLGAIELDELLEGEFIAVVEEQRVFDGFDLPHVAERKLDDEHVNLVMEDWNDMARICGLQVRSRVKYRGNIYKLIRTRFKDAEWVENYPKALDAIPGLEILVKEGSVGTRRWRANFQWFVPLNLVELILNGKYGKPDRKEGMFVNDDNDI